MRRRGHASRRDEVRKRDGRRHPLGGQGESRLGAVEGEAARVEEEEGEVACARSRAVARGVKTRREGESGAGRRDGALA